jgi:16S rRNA (cytidine1402-2'-O)-methyltransferase
MKKGKLFIIPSPISNGLLSKSIPNSTQETLKNIKLFAVENVRTTRRFLKKVDKSIDIDELTFEIIDKRTKEKELTKVLNWLKNGNDVGLLSEAGCPGIADPGHLLIALCHDNKIQVIPEVGPSSLILALMGSGLNGQHFCFNGYLPANPQDRTKTLKKLEGKVETLNQTQLFIETPYRNEHVANAIVKTCSPKLKLCIGKDLTGDEEYLVTKTIGKWKESLPELHKTPCVFILGK